MKASALYDLFYCNNHNDYVMTFLIGEESTKVQLNFHTSNTDISIQWICQSDLKVLTTYKGPSRINSGHTVP